MQKWPHAGETKRTTRGAEKEPRREAGCLRPGVPERNPHPRPAVVTTVPVKRWPRGAQQALLPRVLLRPSWKGKGKELASLDHPRAPLPQGARPRLQPPGERQARHRTPVRAGAGCHWLPSPSPATMAGRSLPSVTVTAAADRASQVRRLHSPGHRQPLLPRAEGGRARRPPGPSPYHPRPRDFGKAVTWRAGGARTRPRGGKGEGRRWPPAQRDLGNLGDLFRTG